MTSSFKDGWVVHEKQGGKGSTYAKYDTELVIIVSRVIDTGKNNKKKPAGAGMIYLSKKAYDTLGCPTHLEVRKNGNLLGFFPADENTPNSYATTMGKDDNRPSYSMRSVIAKFKLKSGVYVAQLYQQHPNKWLVVNTLDTPSQT